MSKIKITVDSTCDLSDEIVRKYDITVVPLYVVLDDKSFKDGVEITPDDIYKFVSENGRLPKTSACPVADYTNIFQRFVDDGYEVLHFSISSSMSSGYQNACIAANQTGGVYVIDSKNLSTGSALLVMDAVDMLSEGKTAVEIANTVSERTSLVNAGFVVDTLEYLKMGGRCSSVAMLGANLLKIKPRIGVKDGVMYMADKYRGQYSKVLTEKYVNDILSLPDINYRRVFITHTKCDPELVNAVVAEVRKLGKFEEVIETVAGCVITSHCGPNTLGVLFELTK